MGNVISNSLSEAKDQEANVNGGQALCVEDPVKGGHLPSAGGDPFQQPLPVNFRHQPSVSLIPQQSNMMLDHDVEREIDEMVLIKKKVRLDSRYLS